MKYILKCRHIKDYLYKEISTLRINLKILKYLLKKDNPANVKTSIKALLLSLNVEDSDTLPDNDVEMAFLWWQNHFSRSYTKLYNISPSSRKHVYLTGKMTAYPQILLNTRNIRFGNLAWKGGKHNYYINFNFPWQTLSRLLRWNYTYKKNCLYTKICCVRRLYEKKQIHWIFYLIQTLRPEEIKKYKCL